METQISASIDQDTRELVLNATSATVEETGQMYSVALENPLGSVTTAQFMVNVTNITNQNIATPGDGEITIEDVIPSSDQWPATPGDGEITIG